jgi:hypothetical protein
LGNWATGKYKVSAPIMDESELEELMADEPTKPKLLEDEDE